MRKGRIFAQHLNRPEGPVLGPDGWILNVCSRTTEHTDWPTRGGDIVATHIDHPLVTHTVFNTSIDEVTGIPAGLAFGPDGSLYIADEGRISIIRASPDGDLIDIITHYEGQRINGANDLCFDEAGNLYFSDPWGSSLEKRIGSVYGLDWESKILHQIHTGLAFPNGILARDNRLRAP